jgi:hypothetical protein
VEIFWIVPDLHRKRYYSISVIPGLFGPVATRSWGRMGLRRGHGHIAPVRILAMSNFGRNNLRSKETEFVTISNQLAGNVLKSTFPI